LKFFSSFFRLFSSSLPGQGTYPYDTCTDGDRFPVGEATDAFLDEKILGSIQEISQTLLRFLEKYVIIG